MVLINITVYTWNAQWKFQAYKTKALKLFLQILPGLGGSKNWSSNCASYSSKLGFGGSFVGGGRGLSGLAPGL